MAFHIITDSYFPYAGASSARIDLYARAIINAGENCSVITLCTLPSSMPYVSSEVYNGVPVHHLFSLWGSKLRICRIISRLIGGMKLLLYLLLSVHKRDSVIVYGFPSSLKKLIARTLKSRHIPCVCELCEYPWAWEEDSLEIERRRTDFFRRVLPLFSGVIVISEALRKVVVDCSNIPIIKIPILIDPDVQIIEEAPPVSFPYIFHSGTLTERKDGGIGMIMAFARVKAMCNVSLKFIITGKLNNSSEHQKIRDIIRQCGIAEDVIFVGYLKSRELLIYQRYCVAAIINKHDNLQNRYCFSTKIGEYMNLARPIITTCVGESMLYLEDGKHAIVVPPESPELIANALLRIMSDDQYARQLGLNGQSLAQTHFSYKLYGKNIIDFFDKLRR